MDKQITHQAIDAAARARSDQWSAETIRSGRGWTWDELTTEDQAKCIEWVEPIVTAALAEVEASITAERDRLAERIDTLLGVADEDGITYSPKELQAARQCYAAFEYDNLVAERDDLAARVARVEALHVKEGCDCIDVHDGTCVDGWQCYECRDAWPCPTIKAIREYKS